MLSIEQSCYWMAASAFEYEPPLEGRQQSEIVIIGGGLTGLWTAIFLREMNPGLDISILEQGMVGYGGSGRNAGIVDTTLDHSHSLAISHFGFDEAERLARLGVTNIREMIDFVSTNGIECELEQTGRLLVALTPFQAEQAQESIPVAEKLGITGWKWMNAEEIRKEVDSPLYLGGVLVPGAFILHPFKLVQGLKRYVKSNGVRIYERSQVVNVAPGVVRTSYGEVASKKIIVATDAFTHHLFPKLLSRFIPLYDYILVSDPLSEKQRTAIGWRNRQGITDGRNFFNYYRLTNDNRILFGTSEAKYYATNRVGPELDHSTSHYEALHDSFLRHFPQIADLQFPFMWGGPIASTTRLTPFFGSMFDGQIHYALGYTGHGLGTTRVAGKILASMALDRPDPLLDLKMVRKKPVPYPPEPLRTIAVNAVTRSLRKSDRGQKPDLLLKLLNWMKIGFSS